MAVNQPLDLTCGIEIECLVLISTPPDQSKYTAVHPFQGQELIHEALSKPIDVRCKTCGVSHEFVLDLNPCMEQSDDEDPEYTKWTVDTDESLDLTVAESMKYHGTLRHVQVFPIEIKSRVLSLTRDLVSKEHAPFSGHTHEISFDAEIDAVYRSLDRYFNSADSPRNIGLVVNHTCSTHVHIGNGRHGFPTSTVKNVLSLCVAHERLIDNLHSTSRINGSTILSASESWARLNHSFRYLQHITAPKVYNSPWSTHFAHTAFLQSDSAVPDEARKFIPEPVYPASRFEASPDLKSAAQRFDVPSWLSIITSAQGITDLRNLQQNSARRSTINLHNLQSYRLDAADSFDFGYRKMTIEFRQHAGTLQSQETLSWLRVLASLFQYAHDNREPDIPKLCLNNWADPSMDSIDFLMMVGVDAGTIKHYEHVLGVSVSQTYADCIRREEQAAVSRDSWDQYLTPVALELIETRTAGISPWNVTSVIREKFARGGYGQFPACYLADMRLHKAAVDILTVGTRPSWATLPSRDSAIDLRASLFDSVRK